MEFWDWMEIGINILILRTEWGYVGELRGRCRALTLQGLRKTTMVILETMISILYVKMFNGGK